MDWGNKNRTFAPRFSQRQRSRLDAYIGVELVCCTIGGEVSPDRCKRSLTYWKINFKSCLVDQHGDDGEDGDNLDEAAEGPFGKELDQSDADQCTQSNDGEHEEVEAEGVPGDIVPNEYLQWDLEQIDHLGQKLEIES